VIPFLSEAWRRSGLIRPLQGPVKPSVVTHCDRSDGSVIVTFADGYTFAFTHDFLFRSRLNFGHYLSAELAETPNRDN
jgi:hypothetical protein